MLEFMLNPQNGIHKESIDEGKFDEKGFFHGDVTNKYLNHNYIEELVIGMHDQYKYCMMGIILGISDPGHPITIPENFEEFKNPADHWVAKNTRMTDVWKESI